MWFRKQHTVTPVPPIRFNRPKPTTIQEYLSLPVSERNGAILTSELFTDVCEAVAALRALQEKP